MFYTTPDPFAHAALALVICGLALSVIFGWPRGVLVSFAAFVCFIFLRIRLVDPSVEWPDALMFTLLIGVVALIIFVPAAYVAQFVRNRRNKSKQ